MSRPLTVELAKDVIVLMEQGWTLGQIVPYLNLSEADVLRVMKPTN